MIPRRPTARLRVLFVADSLYWVTATIARQIARHNPWIEPTICSEGVVHSLLARGADLAGRIDVAHFLTPHIGTALLGRFRDHVPCVTSIYHVEDQRSVEPAPGSDAIMTISRQWHDRLAESGLDADKLVLLHMGVDTDVFRPAKPGERVRLRAAFGIPADTVVVGFSAKKTSDTYNRKGTDILVQAVGILARRRRDVAVVMIGPGWEGVAAHQRSLGVRCVHLPFLLDQARVARVHRSLDIFWVTARIEGGPVPLLEAMSSATCCVTTPVGMVPEVVRDGENGFLAAFDDAEAFARRTEQLADDSAMREGVGESARQTIVGDFRWERTTASAARLYGTAIARFRARCPDASIADLPDPAAAGPTSRMRAEALDAVPRELRDWAASREHLNFMRQLLGMGERRAAAGIALRALARNPLDRCTWREAGPCSPIAPLYRRATSAWHKTRALARVAGPPRGASPRSGTGSADRHAGKP